MEYPTPPERPVAPPGWYGDATGQPRWWDGNRWVEPGEQRPESTWSLFSHLSWFVLPILCPLLVRVIRGKRDRFSKHHATEALNAHLTFLVFLVALIASVWLTEANHAGPGSSDWLVWAFLIWGLAALVWTILSIVGTVQASHGKWWRYPFSIRFVPGATKDPPSGGSKTSAPPIPLPSEVPLAERPPDVPYVTYQLPTQPANSSSKRLTFILLGVLAGLAIVGGVVSSVVSITIPGGPISVSDAAPGVCLKALPTGSQLVGTLDAVACEETHAAEVFAVLTMPDGDFPGQSAIEAFADKCGPALTNYAPHPTSNSIDVAVLFPTAESWAQGDRSITCIASWDPPRAGSIKG